MSCIRSLNRLPFIIQNSSFVYSRTSCQIRFISSSIQSRIFLNRNHPPKRRVQIVPPVAPFKERRNIVYVQFRANHTGEARLEKFLLPDIGEGISEVSIKEWHVKVGDVVNEFDALCEVESDKATASITSRFNGTIKGIHYEVGEMAKVGKPLVDIEVLGSVASPSQVNQESPEPNKVPPAADASSLRQATLSTGSGGGGSSSSSSSARSNYEVDMPKRLVTALPSVRRFAQEMNIDLALVKATGSRGQVLKEDVIAYRRAQMVVQTNDQHQSNRNNDSTHSQETSEASQTTTTTNTTVVPLQGIQRVMFKTMTESLKIPHFNYADEIDLTSLMEANSRLQKEGGGGASAKKIANFAFIIKMVSLALLEYPQLNASLDEAGQNLIHKHYHNIGVAVDTRAGLMVPNIKNVQNLSVAQVNEELLRLRELGYASKLGPGDLSGGTLTLSNIGAIGGTFGVPVIVSPELVIGALGRARTLPRFNAQGQLEARHIMQIVWSADHRAVDGATLSRFSNLLKQYLEAPHSALLKLS